jgi:uncharacterized protein (DUF302 family)
MQRPDTFSNERSFIMTPAADNGIVHLAASRPVDEVLQHLLSILGTKGITVFAVVDHSGEAAKAGFEMRPTKLVLFGNPKAGTPLMIAAPESALDLPLKILIAQEPSGRTRVSYNSVAYLQARYGLAQELMANVAAIDKIAAAVAGYEL